MAAIVVLVACTPPLVADEPPATRASLLRVVTWNVHDLFDETDHLTPPGDEDLVLAHDAVESKLARIRAVLARLDPDVVVLQEVENLELLERLAGDSLAGGRYRAFLREGYDPRGIDVGVLARTTFEPGPSHVEDRAPDGRRLWSRDVLEIHVPFDGRELVVLGAHLVSRLDPSEDARRQLQAARLRAIVDTLRREPSPPISVLLVGDLNDVPTSSTLAPLLADGELADLGAAVPVTAAWTWSGDGTRERIDYALIPAADRALVVAVAVASGPDVNAASDHRPVVVDLWAGGSGG